MAKLSHLGVEEVSQCIPLLSPKKYKGQSGKIAVIGGCREYTGAPYFAAFSSLKMGGDLAHIFCTTGAATVIKSYSPELIVHPYLHDPGEQDIFREEKYHPDENHVQSRVVEDVVAWLDKFDSVIIGPGLGRNELVLRTVAKIVESVKKLQIPLVIDADGLWLVKENVDIIKGYDRAVLTPNVIEFQRLAASLNIDPNHESALNQICDALEGPIIVQKGGYDMIASPGRSSVLVCSETGSLRRAGGQGDVLSGAIATFAAWVTSARCLESKKQPKGEDFIDAMLRACYSGCLVTRRASHKAFTRRGRAMGAEDIIYELGPVVDQLASH
jgi:ATP-dependent NAD(P)H-hydrate dehydratase